MVVLAVLYFCFKSILSVIGLGRLHRCWVRCQYERHECRYERFYLDLPWTFSELLEGFLDKPLSVEVKKSNSGLLVGIKALNLTDPYFQ